MLSLKLLVVLATYLASSGQAVLLESPLSVPHELRRHTLAFGPVIEHRHASVVNSLASDLVAFNTLLATGERAISGDEASEETPVGLRIAQAFVKSLYPKAQFVVDSSYLSKHNSIYHAYLVQTIRGIRVDNALLNVNVDLANNQILSFGDSFWKGYPIKAEQAKGQFVFSPVVQLDDRHYMLDDPYSSEKTLIDPRLAVRSLLQIGSPNLSANSMPIAHWLETIVPTQSLHSENGIETHLNDVPGADGAVPAKLVYLQTEDGRLELTWRLRYQSEMNAYEAHVKASCEGECNTEEALATQAEPLMVVDWQKDFRSDLQANAAIPAHLTQTPFSTHDDLPLVEAESKHRDEPKVARYRIWPWSVNDPSEGPREVVVDPADKTASPRGWHEVPLSNRKIHPSTLDEGWSSSAGWSSVLQRGFAANFTDTRGNNVFAQDNPNGGNEFELNYRPNAPDLNFTFPLGWHCSGSNCTGHDINPHSYLNVSISQLFYTCNMMHDLTLRYGFDEASGNFQERNFGKEGLENDAVIANAADGSGMNNANFMTPPDGSRARMRMYIWNSGGQLPMRDGDLEEGIVIHEYTHGVSTRLTGGPANSGCLAWSEAGGMGEGWGDWIATLVRMHKKKVKDWDMGSWASGRAGGIRKFPYSVNSTTNSENYKSVDRMFEVHSIGAVWAEILFVVTEELIKAHGFHYDLFPPAPLHNASITSELAAHKDFYKKHKKTDQIFPAHGNTLAMQLVIDGMKLQPCRPDFLDARDAIIAADHALTGGDNFCHLWRGFSKKGLGLQASVRGRTPFGGGIRTASDAVPAKCK